ncbi:SUMF1/EgtB/PvdO family nonheme iron enzyme [Candidatus Halobeggiatoa sp. HSG11]|nr:SUMF1/EgtB/PvdO family nonheme iron enzyme [Candidatus Halobeggiatoa sp. HSG11]
MKWRSYSVWEWCADVWNDNYRKAPNDGSVWKIGSKHQVLHRKAPNDDSVWEIDSGYHRVLRGGSWIIFSDYIRAATRSQGYQFSHNTGFRVVRSLPIK